MPAKIPLSLKILAWLLILDGVRAAIETLLDLSHNRVFIQFDFVDIFVGWGLLRLRPGWRTFALVIAWLNLLASLVAACFFATHSGSVKYVIFGRIHLSLTNGILSLLILPFFAFFIWELWVLMRPDVRQLFIPNPIDPNAATPREPAHPSP
jgi:hypothetical protein